MLALVAKLSQQTKFSVKSTNRPQIANVMFLQWIFIGRSVAYSAQIWYKPYTF